MSLYTKVRFSTVCGFPIFSDEWRTETETLDVMQNTTDKTKDHDPVNHPRHYTSHPSGIECIQVTRHMTFNIGNAFKYLWRAGLKDATIQDLEKAIWYIEDEIWRIKNLSPKQPDPKQEK